MPYAYSAQRGQKRPSLDTLELELYSCESLGMHVDTGMCHVSMQQSMCMHIRIHLLAPLKAKLTMFCGEERCKRQVTQLPCWQEGVKAQCCPSRRVLGYSSPAALQYHLATAPRDMSCWFWAQPILTHLTWASQEVTERSTG